MLAALKKTFSLLAWSITTSPCPLIVVAPPVRAPLIFTVPPRAQIVSGIVEYAVDIERAASPSRHDPGLDPASRAVGDCKDAMCDSQRRRADGVQFGNVFIRGAGDLKAAGASSITMSELVGTPAGELQSVFVLQLALVAVSH